MNPEDKIKELERKVEELTKKVSDLYSPDSLPLEVQNTFIGKGFLQLGLDNIINLGISAIANQPIKGAGTASELYGLSLAVGKDKNINGFSNKAKSLQFNLLHYPLNTSEQDFITAFRDPIGSVAGSTISVTAGNNTVTVANADFTTNELAGAVINIINSSGALVESKLIASNTSTVITITGTWASSTSGGTYFAYFPVYFGEAGTVYQRFYTQEGTDGGIRFGIGTTSGGQNGLLYMDSAGDIYWRNKSGASTKLN